MAVATKPTSAGGKTGEIVQIIGPVLDVRCFLSSSGESDGS